ncbi:hypothetical protein PIB30_072466 [Stylosanthes scabra]|uniref:Uncharacterized protein n=1 Tax=Stylosanthes scabra TaxID=79078 RepID=A0ABU6ZMQ5_9FABA|nr:hypothetical protein [Stylosanthes scabra]
MAMILGLSSHGVPVTGWTGTSIEALKGECMLNFGVQPDDSDIKASSFIKISWIRTLGQCVSCPPQQRSMQGDPIRLSGYRWASGTFACMGLGENAIPRSGFDCNIFSASSPVGELGCPE